MKQLIGRLCVPVLAVLLGAVLLDAGVPKLLAFAIAVVFTLFAHFVIGFFRGIRKCSRMPSSFD